MKYMKNTIYIILLISTGTFYGCGVMMGMVEKIVDPYSRKYKCPNPQGFDCIDLDASYAADQEIQSEKNENHTDSGHDMLSKPEPDDFGDFITDDLKNTLEQAAGNPKPEPVSEILMKHIRDRKSFPKIETRLLEQIGENYLQCIEDAEKKAKKLKLTDGAATKALHECSALLANVPGLVPFKSTELSEKLKIQRESDAKKVIAQSVSPGATPIRVPAKGIRIFIAPYVDNRDVFNQGHFIFTTIGEGRWVLPEETGKHNTAIKVLEK